MDKIIVSIFEEALSMSFKKIEHKELQLNPITMFLNDWPLLTSGNEENGYNTMTISWGHIGGIWNKPTMTVYVRPQRYTKAFIDSNELFTVSILPSAYKKALAYLGRVSGRDEDKVSKTGITPIFDQDTTYFDEAKLIFVCRKLYQGPIKEESFLDPSLSDQMYPEKDFHTMYIGEVVEILTKD
jgi:flavin reductase (DIM6/NTAB) family NADH-FMN oxidoreductase RutF